MKPQPIFRRKRTAGAPGFAPLTSGQRQQIAILRSKAHAYQTKLGLTTDKADVWNAAVTNSVLARKRGGQTSKTSLTEANQADFAMLMGYFCELGGDATRAAYWYKRDDSGLSQSTLENDTPEDRRREIYLLREECEKKKLPFPEYPLAIARNRNWFETGRATLEDLTPHELFSLKVTVKAKAKVRPTPEP